MDEPRAALAISPAESHTLESRRFGRDEIISNITKPAGAPAFSVSEPVALRRFEIGSGPGDSWTLKLYEAGEEMGGGQYPADDYDAALENGQDWVDAAPIEAAGIDMPGVGHVHETHGGLSYEVAAIERLEPAPRETGVAAALMNGIPEPAQVLMSEHVKAIARAEAAVLRGRPYRAGEVPATLRDQIDRDDRERLLIQLMFAASRLADWSIAKRLPFGHDVCPDCGAIARRTSEKMYHQPTCHIGAVTDVIDQLEYQQHKSQQAKEEASTGESGAAGDGIRTPGMKHRVCMLCGEQDGVWEGEYSDGSVNLSLLGLNQRVGPGPDGIGHTLYTHRCGSHGGAR